MAPLSSGARLGVYEIAGLLGAGGMGEEMQGDSGGRIVVVQGALDAQR
jgi:hypothetical protein